MSSVFEWNWPVIIALIGQSIAAIKWAAGLSTSVQYIKSAIDDIRQELDEKYPQRDGRRLEHKLDVLEAKLYQIGRRETPQTS